MDDEIETSLDRVVKGQLESGIDIGNSGEQPRVSFVTYVPQRMSGFGGESRVNTPLDLDRFPKYAESYLKKFAGAAVDGPTAMSSEQSKIFNAPQAVREVKYDEAMTGVTEELDAFERSVGRQVGIGALCRDLHHRRAARRGCDGHAPRREQPPLPDRSGLHPGRPPRS